MAANSIVEYLQAARARLERSDRLTLVLGNESADLDSMASSLAYALLLFRQITDGSATSLPVMNIPREDFKLRMEAVRLFGDLGIDRGELPFIGELELDQLSRRARVRLVLVDHNVLAPHQANLAPLVEEIIDHHRDGGLYPHVQRRTIDPVGSTATLVSERINESKLSLFDSQLATLLLGTILLDTANLDVTRIHERDQIAVRFLQPLVDISRDKLFDNLESEKFNPGSLSTFDLLRKDCKEGQGSLRYAISSVPISTAAWRMRDSRLTDGFKDYAARRDVDVLITMQFYKAGDFKREIGVYSASAELRQRFLRSLADADMQLEPLLRLPDDPAISEAVEFFTQKNTELARKNIQRVLDQLQ